MYTSNETIKTKIIEIVWALFIFSDHVRNIPRSFKIFVDNSELFDNSNFRRVFPAAIINSRVVVETRSMFRLFASPKSIAYNFLNTPSEERRNRLPTNIASVTNTLAFEQTLFIILLVMFIERFFNTIPKNCSQFIKTVFLHFY